MATARRNSRTAVGWEGVSKTYPNGFQAVRDVSLQAREGEVLALLGTSGSGKTTLLKMVNRLEPETSGRVLVDGKPTADWRLIDLRRSMGYVIQEGGLMPHLSILDNVALAAKIQGVDRASARDQAKIKLALVGLDPDRFGGLFPHKLSGGQRQRVGVARALAASDKLILMDEPFGALDPITRREIQDEFLRLQRELGTTVILVTHDIREACRMGDRLALLHEGRLLQTGHPADFLNHPADDYVARFFRDAGAVEIGREAHR